MWISGRVVRIPLPQMRAGLKDRWKRRVRYRRNGSQIKLRGSQAATRRLRRGLHEEAALYRSWTRWLCIGVLWIAIGAGALLVPWSRFSPWHFGLLVAFAASFVAGFARHRGVRTAAATLIVTAGGLSAGWGCQPEVCLVGALSGFGLLVQNVLT